MVPAHPNYGPYVPYPPMQSGAGLSLRGRVVSNREARRSIRLEDGREVSFSLEACAFKVHVDQTVWVNLDSTATLATHVTIADPNVQHASRVSCLSLLPRVHEIGLARELDDLAGAALLDDLGCDADDDTALEDLLDAYYADREEAAIEDGWLSFDWRHPLRILIDDINRVVGGPPLLKLVSVTEDRPPGSSAIVTVTARDGSQAKRRMEHSEEILVVANEVLASSGDGRAFFIVRGGDDTVRTVLATSERASALGELIQLAPAGS